MPNNANLLFIFFLHILKSNTLYFDNWDSIVTCVHVNTDKKSLNIPKGQSESVNHRRQTIQWTKEKVQKEKDKRTKQ
jgi:hypothetical protein